MEQLTQVDDRARALRLPAWAVLVVLLLALVGTAPPAAAHEALLSSDPPESGLLEVLPSRAVLTFSGPVREVHEIEVTGPDGSAVNGRPSFSGAEVRQNLWAGPDGDYVMTYDVTSSDGHEINGEVHFEVGSVSTSTTGAAAGAAVDPAEAAAPRPGYWEEKRGALLPAGLVLLGGTVAVVAARRSRTRRTS